MDLPLFPLHTVLAPGVVLPLHIFEERYRTMIRRCLDEGTPFGVILIREGREVGRSAIALAGVGTIATIREVTRHDDGTLDLLTVGTRRFSLLSVDAVREPYLVGEVRELDEPVGDAARAARLVDRVSRSFIRYVALVAEVEERAEAAGVDLDDDEDEEEDEEPTADAGDDEEEDGDEDEDDVELTIPDDPTTLSHLLGGILAIEPARRQELLEAATSEARLGLLADLLTRETLLLERGLGPWTVDPRRGPASRN